MSAYEKFIQSPYVKAVTQQDRELVLNNRVTGAKQPAGQPTRQPVSQTPRLPSGLQVPGFMRKR